MSLGRMGWITISGMVWFMIGIGLLTLGVNFIISAAQFPDGGSYWILSRLSSLSGGAEPGASTLILLGLFIGFMKGRFVLAKTAKRVVSRILSLEEPIRFFHVYGKGYLFLIGGMVVLGMSMKWIQIPLDVRGGIDVAVGSALMHGASSYFRSALTIRKQLKKS